MSLRSLGLSAFMRPLYAADGDAAAEPADPPVIPPVVPDKPRTAEDAPPSEEVVATAEPEADKPESAALLPDNEVEPPKPTEPAKPDWRDKEIGKKHAQLKAAKESIAAKEREIEDLRAIAERTSRREPDPAAADDAPAPRAAPSSPAPVDPALVQNEAQKLIAQRDYDAACNQLVETGQKEYGTKWNEALTTLQTLGGPDGAIDMDTMTGILATDNPSKVLFELGSKPEEYQRIMELPLPKRMTELVKIALTQAPKPKISAAPPPVDPVGGRGAGNANELRDDLPDDEWNRRRTAQKDAKWKARHGASA